MLRLAVWYIIVLKIVLAVARPDFGIDGMVQGTQAVVGAAGALQAQFQRLASVLDFQLSSSDDQLSAFLVPLQTIAETVAETGTALTTFLASLASSNGDLLGSYGPVMSALAQVQTFREDGLPVLLSTIASLGGASVARQLSDVFQQVNHSITNLFGALLQLIVSITSSDSADDVSATLVRLVEQTVDALRANVVVMVFTIGSTGKGLYLADEFMTQLTTTLDQSSTADTSSVNQFNSELDLLRQDLTNRTACLVQGYENFEQSVEGALSSLQNSTDCFLQTVAESLVHTLTSDWERVVCVVRTHYQTLLADGSGFIEDLSTVYGAIRNLGTLLAGVTFVNGPYAQYCYYKYGLLVLQLAQRLTDDVGLCLATESVRLRSLQNSLAHMFPTVLYDVEDLLPTLEVCGQLYEQRDQCLREVGEVYELLASKTDAKLVMIEKFSFSETGASLDRLKVCVLRSTYTVLYQKLACLRLGIEQCQSCGPNCTTLGQPSTCASTL